MGSGETRRGDRQLDLEGGKDAQAAQRWPAWACVCGLGSRSVSEKSDCTNGKRQKRLWEGSGTQAEEN